MIEGIYHVRFSSRSHEFGTGVVVLKGRSINGGDHGYLYSGSLAEQDNTFTATLRIERWNPGAQSVFGPLDKIALELSGNFSGDHNFIARGHVAEHDEQKIDIHGKFLAPAV